MQEKRLKKITALFIIGIMYFFLGMIAVRIIVQNVVVQRFHVENKITDFLTGKTDSVVDDEMELDWETQYPFTAETPDDIVETVENINEDKEEEQKVTALDKLKHKLNLYVSDDLFEYKQIVEAAGRYDRLIGWNLHNYAEYNSVSKLDDGYLAVFKEEVDVTEPVESLTDFYQFCSEQDISFLYVQAPGKIGKYVDLDISGKLDFSNQNMDQLIGRLNQNQVPVLDIRELLKDEDQQSYHAKFYRTDHHWRTETGLWAAKQILHELNSSAHLEADETLLDTDRFTFEKYENWFLGSQGKKVTLAQTEPDDFCMIYPKYETLLRCVIPSRNFDETGDFSVTYNMRQMDKKDYYERNPYGAYNHNGSAYTEYFNEEKGKQGKILFIGDSFEDCVVPFLALTVQNVNVLDLREFDGSVRSYVEENKPDAVVVMYNPSSLNEIDWTTHISTYDFS